MKEEYINQYRMLLGAYFGVMSMDEYPLKVYVIKEIENYTDAFLKSHKFKKDFPYQEEKDNIEKENIKLHLQDALLVLNKINADLDLVHLVRLKLLALTEEDK